MQKTIWGLTISVLGYLGKRQFEETGQLYGEFFRMVHFHYLHIWEIKFLSMIEPVNCFGLVIQEIMENNYTLKTNFEKS